MSILYKTKEKIFRLKYILNTTQTDVAYEIVELLYDITNNNVYLEEIDIVDKIYQYWYKSNVHELLKLYVKKTLIDIQKKMIDNQNIDLAGLVISLESEWQKYIIPNQLAQLVSLDIIEEALD